MKQSNSFSISQFYKRFPDDKSCRDYYEKVRWNGKPICPHCNCDKAYRYKDGRLRCSSCKRFFSLTKGTIFERTRFPLQTWFLAIYLLSISKKGISSYHLAGQLGTTQKNAWFLLHRIRKAMSNNPEFKKQFDSIVEIDETFVGGKNKNRHYNKRFKHSQGRSTIDKMAVLGFYDRKTKRVTTLCLNHLKSRSLQLLVKNKTTERAVLMTDEYSGYNGLKERNEHHVISHSKYEYVRGAITTNAIEGFWSILKRGIIGIYHKTSRKHLKRYCKEFEFRYNTKDLCDEERFNLCLTQFEGVRLSLKDLR